MVASETNEEFFSAPFPSSELVADWYHRVKLVDGTMMTLADTPADLDKYPQPTSQKAGRGFLMIRVCVAFSLLTAMVADASYGAYRNEKTGETLLFRNMNHFTLVEPVLKFMERLKHSVS
jgi:hypothetical protein